MSQSRSRSVLIAFILGNLALIFAFPPYDYVSLEYLNVPTFDGFYFLLAEHPNRMLNSDFLMIEVLVVLINGGIGWLALRPSSPRQSSTYLRLTRGLMVFVAVNLIVMLLFPPFENYRSLSKAMIPGFEGFYFVFADNSTRHLVSEILFLEIALLLVNAGLLLLIFKESAMRPPTPKEIEAMVKELQKINKR